MWIGAVDLPDSAPAVRKVYVVDTSVLVSAPDAIQNLTTDNTVLLPFPVLQELDRRRTDTNGIGYTARNTIRFLDQLQGEASPEQLRHGIPLNGGPLRLHGGGPGTAACLGCHDTRDAAAHAYLNTAVFGEACGACHGANSEWSVSKVHAR